MASRITRIASLPALLLLGSTAAWAGRGDYDPNYGDGGRLAVPAGIPLALPGDRLMISEPTGAGLRIRMVDATGQNDPAFGDGGVVVIDSAAAQTFRPDTAALAPNGDLIFVGPLSEAADRALLRVDSHGQPVLSFGSRGDGFVDTALTANRTIALTVGPDGKIVIVEGSNLPDESGCRRTARLLRVRADGQTDAQFGADGVIEIPDLELCDGIPFFGTRADGGVIVGNGGSIVAVDATGAIDPTFGTDGRLTLTTALANLAWPRGRLLPDGGLLILGTIGESPTSNDTVFLKFDRNGQPDPDFGVSGSLTVDLGAALLGEPFDWEFTDAPMLDPDGEHLVMGFSLKHASDGSVACSGIARLAIDGTPDTGFGRNGLTCLNFDHSLIAVQSSGAPLFFAGYDNAIHRLLPDNSPSPGLLRVVEPTVSVAESQGKATVNIERLAGRDGAVSVDYATTKRSGYRRYGYGCYRCYYYVDSATAGSDYTAASGRLDWANGDDSQHTVNVSILEDSDVEHSEIFGVDFSEPGGGTQVISASLSVLIGDNDQASTTPPPPPPPDLKGGGGSVSWATPLALLALIFIRRRRKHPF